MRRVLLLGLCVVVAGCGSKPKPTTAPPGLPTTSVPRDNRVDAFLLWQQGYGRKALPEKHPFDGKRVLLMKLSDVYATTDGDGKPALLYGSEKDKYMPAIVARLSDTTGYVEGEMLPSAYVEGNLRGCVSIATESWASPWLHLPQQKPLQNRHIILVEDAKLVSAPKD